MITLDAPLLVDNLRPFIEAFYDSDVEEATVIIPKKEFSFLSPKAHFFLHTITRGQWAFYVANSSSTNLDSSLQFFLAPKKILHLKVGAERVSSSSGPTFNLAL